MRLIITPERKPELIAMLYDVMNYIALIEEGFMISKSRNLNLPAIYYYMPRDPENCSAPAILVPSGKIIAGLPLLYQNGET